MNVIVYSNEFDRTLKDEKSEVFEYCPKLFKDNRGGFCQKLTDQKSHDWVNDLSFIKQVNYSYSKPNVFRGFHAQTAPYCQGKLVENMTKAYPIYDIIIDARPDSKTFGVTKIFKLNPYDSEMHNMLWVPRGFLHSFMTPSYFINQDGKLEKIDPNTDFIFQYFCDNTYSPANETGVKPSSVFPDIMDLNKGVFKDIEETMKEDFTYSKKDENNTDYKKFMKSVKSDFTKHKKLWYK